MYNCQCTSACHSVCSTHQAHCTLLTAALAGRQSVIVYKLSCAHKAQFSNDKDHQARRREISGTMFCSGRSGLEEHLKTDFFRSQYFRRHDREFHIQTSCSPSFPVSNLKDKKAGKIVCAGPNHTANTGNFITIMLKGEVLRVTMTAPQFLTITLKL